MDKDVKIRAIRAAKVLVDNQALLDYLVAYYEERYLALSRTMSIDETDTLIEVFKEYRFIDEIVTVLKNLANEDNGQ